MWTDSPWKRHSFSYWPRYYPRSPSTYPQNSFLHKLLLTVSLQVPLILPSPFSSHLSLNKSYYSLCLKRLSSSMFVSYSSKLLGRHSADAFLQFTLLFCHHAGKGIRTLYVLDFLYHNKSSLVSKFLNGEVLYQWDDSQLLSFSPRHDLLLYSNMSSYFSYLSLPFTSKKHCSYITSWMSLLFSHSMQKVLLLIGK